MMRLSLVLLALLFFALEARGTAATAKPASRDEVTAAIAVFQKEPTSKEGFAAATVIKSYAKTTNAVHLSKAIVPWVKTGEEEDADTRDILFTAYLAGDIQAELKSGKATDDVYAGWEQVLDTYAQLLKINPAAKIAEVDDLKKKEADGKLRAYAAEVQGK